MQSKEIIGLLKQEAIDNMDEKQQEAEEKAKDTKEEKKRGRKKVRGTEVRTGKTGSYDDADQRSGKKSPGTAEARGGIGCGYGRDRDPCKRLPSAGKCVATLNEIKNNMKLLEADLKGIQVDEEG